MTARDEGLRSEIEAAAAASTLRITTRGRRSGKPHSVPIWFALSEGAIVFGTLNDQRDWVRNARKTPEVELAIGALRLRGIFRDVTGDSAALAAVRRAIAGKYWIPWVLSWVGIGQKFAFRVERLERVGSGSRAGAGA